MVTAGVYLLARSYPLLQHAPVAGAVIAALFYQHVLLDKH
jgi:NADH:ubiquinone oxidoreductase subunit 5 (subunit L)/multisubunit Na+/H+ antiporter MnhA subunit